MDLTLANFLNYYNIDVSSVYATKTSFADFVCRRVSKKASMKDWKM